MQYSNNAELFIGLSPVMGLHHLAKGLIGIHSIGYSSMLKY
ncbi:hypothetical protein yinte0001_420 [Yersinia intermedia ATCC 29909]|nr:hypothetical protein yinte0001_420 [Yersinia intermedia ATCC 29909]